MTWEGTGASGGYDAGAYLPGPARTSGAGCESGNGTYGGVTLLANGYTSKPIIGVPLDGGTFGGGTVSAIPATDHGRLAGDARWVHAVGPMQFLPSTWAKWGADGNGDGVVSPNQIDDAALAAARYLCASGTMTNTAGWRAAVFSYNQSTAYVDEVAAIANRDAADVSRLS
jgi:membrane-bound lytic murein transglycosylase B